MVMAAAHHGGDRSIPLTLEVDVLMMIKELLAGDKGVTAIEYGLIAGMIAVVSTAVIADTGGDLYAVFDAIHEALERFSDD